MKIAIITQYYKPEIGAPQNRLYEMAVGLKKNGWDISIITAFPNYPTGKIFNGYRWKFRTSEVLDELLVKRYWLYASNSKRILPRILNMLSFSLTSLHSTFFIWKGNFDFVIVESPPMTLCLTGYLISRFTKTKLILNISDLWPLSAKELGAISDGRLYRLLERSESFFYRKAFLCMGQSEEIITHLSNKGARNTYLFRNGVDPERFGAGIRTILKEHPKIVYAGLLGVAQGILELCKNIDFKKLGSEFHIYGDGGEKASIELYVQEHYDSGIFFHGKVGRDDIPKILNQYDATLISLVTNIYGAVPSKIYESMAAGLPILFSGDGEAKKIIEKYNLGWVSAPCDYPALINNIKEMRNIKDEYIQKSHNCKNTACSHFNRPKQIEMLGGFLMKMI